MDNKLRKQLFEQRTKEYDDYYNRSSIQSSYTIAVIAGIVIIIMTVSMGVLKLIEKVSEGM